MSVVGPAVPGPPREDSLTLSSFRLQESKLRPPWARPGIVPRTKLVERLMRASAPVVSVVAPPGYGKTTALAQWAGRKGRMAWVGIDRRDNDPTILLAYLAAAVDRVESLGPEVIHALASPGAVATTVVSRLVEALTVRTEPVALVLDNLESLEDQPSLDVVAELAVQFSARHHDGSQLALVSRANPPLPMTLLRAQGRLVEVGVEELAMDQQETRLLLEGAGVQPAEVETTDLIRWTEGWPVGLYLAALSLKAESLGNGKEVRLSGGDRFVADYLWSELLARVPPETVSFLTRTSLLDRLSGPLCDAVLDATGSAQTLERLQRSNLLVIPLDDQRQWYRYHRMFRELLRAELERREPELVDELVLRAAAWCEHHGLPETSIDYALQAGDAEHAARLVGDLGLGACPSGRLATVRPWLAWFERHDLVERHPGVAVLGAWVHALAGHAADAERWADAAERAVSMETPPERSIPMQGWLAALRAAMCRKGVEQSCGDAELACTLLPRGNPWRATAFLLLGMAHLTLGNLDSADQQLAEAVELAEDSGATATSVLALAERAVVANDRETWPQSELLIERARSVAHHERLDDDVTSILLYAAAARVAVHQGEVQRARAELTHAQRPRPRLTVALPVYAVQARLELARTYLALSDVAGARTMLREVDEVLRRRPHLGVLGRQAEELGAQVDTMHANMLGASALTAAELRLLPLLATHLSFRELGERLDLSPHTVKTQAISIYRKLGASTRSQAIQHAQQLGLLPA